MTNRERAEQWVADRIRKGFYQPTTTDDLTKMLDEVRADALREAAQVCHARAQSFAKVDFAKASTCYLDRDAILALLK